MKKYLPPYGFLALIGLMLATRFHHFGSAFSLPDASLIVFFFSGLFFNQLRWFALLLVEVALIDYTAISQFNVSDFCISPAYVALIPTYWIMWQAGIYVGKLKIQTTGQNFLMQFGLLFLATSIAFLISDGSFYLFSGRYPVIDAATYLKGVELYYPLYLSATLLYGLILGVCIRLAKLITAHRGANNSQLQSKK